MPSTNWSPTSINSTNWSGTTINSTNYANTSINSTNWEDDDPSAGIILLESSSYLLNEGSGQMLLQ